MPESYTVFDNVLFWGLLTLMTMAGVLSALVCRRLKTRHPAAYSEMGSPGVVLAGLGDTGRAASRFLWGKKYREMSDPYLAQLAGLLRVLAILVVAVFVVGVVKALVEGAR